MSAPTSSTGGGSNAAGIAIGAGFLILFLNGPAPDTTKLAVVVGVATYIFLSRKSSGGGHSAGH